VFVSFDNKGGIPEWLKAVGKTDSFYGWTDEEDSHQEKEGHREEDGDDLTPRTTSLGRPTVTPLNQPTVAPYNSPLLPELATPIQPRQGTTAIDQPTATPLKAAPLLVDRSVPASAATVHQEEECHQEENGNDPTRLGTPDTEARGITKSTTHVPPTAVSWQEYEEADVSLLSRLTKDDSDAALAVRLCTEGKTTATRDHYWLFKDN
jgi:hypothetical protein